MRFVNFLILFAPIILCGCSDQQFQRFLDHPILSWAPFSQADLDRLDPLSTSHPVVQRYVDPECKQLAHERTEYLDRNEYSDDELADLFKRNYHQCIAAKSPSPSR